jgi:hypothetical protein
VRLLTNLPKIRYTIKLIRIPATSTFFTHRSNKDQSTKGEKMDNTQQANTSYLDIEKLRRQCRDRLNKGSEEDILAVAEALEIPIQEVPLIEIICADMLEVICKVRDSGLELPYVKKFFHDDDFSNHIFKSKFECYRHHTLLDFFGGRFHDFVLGGVANIQ